MKKKLVHFIGRYSGGFPRSCEFMSPWALSVLLYLGQATTEYSEVTCVKCLKMFKQHKEGGKHVRN